MKKLAIILAIILACGAAEAASVTSPTVLAWEQPQADLIIPAGQTLRPLNKWIMYVRDVPGGPAVSFLDIAYDASKLTGPVNGFMTYTSVPIAITATGTGGTTVQKCFVVTAYGNHTPPPPKETAPSNEVCKNFVLPPDPITAPGPAQNLRVQ